MADAVGEGLAAVVGEADERILAGHHDVVRVDHLRLGHGVAPLVACPVSKGRRAMKKLLGLSVVLMIAPVAHAADIEAGKAKVATVCAACHGAGGVSVSDTIPNLAAQRAGYLEAQLKALKDGDRKSTRLNSSHGYISYAVFCLKKKKNIKLIT